MPYLFDVNFCQTEFIGNISVQTDSHYCLQYHISLIEKDNYTQVKCALFITETVKP